MTNFPTEKFGLSNIVRFPKNGNKENDRKGDKTSKISMRLKERWTAVNKQKHEKKTNVNLTD